MGRTSSRGRGQGLSSSAETGQYARRFRPRLELLEERVQLGDTLLGLWAVVLWGLDGSSRGAPFALDSAEYDRVGHRGLFSRWDVLPSLSLADGHHPVASSASSGEHTS